jgi:hypothetical protein
MFQMVETAEDKSLIAQTKLLLLAGPLSSTELKCGALSLQPFVCRTLAQMVNRC